MDKVTVDIEIPRVLKIEAGRATVGEGVDKTRPKVSWRASGTMV
jgi:hypothetical protein